MPPDTTVETNVHQRVEVELCRRCAGHFDQSRGERAQDPEGMFCSGVAFNRGSGRMRAGQQA